MLVGDLTAPFWWSFEVFVFLRENKPMSALREGLSYMVWYAVSADRRPLVGRASRMCCRVRDHERDERDLRLFAYDYAFEGFAR